MLLSLHIHNLPIARFMRTNAPRKVWQPMGYDVLQRSGEDFMDSMKHYFDCEKVNLPIG